jgi:hypothetical protein
MRDLASSIDHAREVGEDFGPGLAALVRKRSEPQDSPPDKEISAAFAESVLDVIGCTMRLRFSSATDPSTYEAIGAIRSWFRPLAWANLSKESAAAERLASYLVDGLRLAARQGRGDDGLAARLEHLVGEDRAMKMRTALSQEPGISPDVRNWLVGREQVKQSEVERRTAEEGRRGEELVAVAEAFRDARTLGESLLRVREDLIGELDVVAPGLKPAFEQLAQRAQVLVQSAGRLGARRGLVVRGTRGEILDYSPIEQDLLEGGPGVRRVRIVEPLVELARSDRTVGVILKALVVPVKEP